MTALIELRPEGLYCPAGDFHIDPWRPVPRAVITHAHADHARSGSGRYWAAAPGAALLYQRLGAGTDLVAMRYGEPFALGHARVSLHPAGHVLGSAQVRVEVDGEVWVASGDYKRDADPTCAPFEVVPCDTFITEATFALPVYRWPAPADVAREILEWWHRCADEGRAAVLFCYALGKAQRLLAELAGLRDEIPVDRHTVVLHGAMTALVQAYRDAGVTMLPTASVGEQPRGEGYAGRLVLAPPGAAGSPWLKRFGHCGTGFASGWMRIRGNRRRRGYDRGFVVSDHADWPGLLHTVEQTGARRVLVTHGHGDALIRVLRDRSVDAAPLATPYGAEED